MMEVGEAGGSDLNQGVDRVACLVRRQTGVADGEADHSGLKQGVDLVACLVRKQAGMA